MPSYFIDPSLDSDTGTGTLSDPYGDLEYAISTAGQNTSAGNIYNIKSGTAEVLEGSLSLWSSHIMYGTTIRGYDSVEDDGGRAEIDCDGFSFYTAATAEGLVLQNLDIHNCTGDALVLDRYCYVANCSFSDIGANAIEVGDESHIIGCHIHDVGGMGISMEDDSTRDNINVSNCFLHDSSTRAMTVAIDGSINAVGNIIAIKGGIGIRTGFDGSNASIVGNSILSTDATGSTGISINRGWNVNGVAYNLVEGFTTGLDVSSTADDAFGAFVYNGFFNCTTDTDIHSNLIHVGAEDNESLPSTPFAKSGTLGISTVADYFAPNDVGNVYAPAGSLVPRYKGAICPSVTGGGGGSTLHPLRSTR